MRCGVVVVLGRRWREGIGKGREREKKKKKKHSGIACGIEKR